MRISRRRRSFSFGRFFAKTFLLTLVAAGIAAFFLFFEKEAPTIDLTRIPPFLSTSEDLEITVHDSSSGIRQVVMTASQGDITKEILTVTNERQGYTGQVGPAQLSRSVRFDAGKLGFKEGPITLRVRASDFSMMGFFKGNMASATVNTTLDTGPPIIRVLHSEQYISPGGSGIVMYSVDDPQSSHGVMINGHFNPGHPLSTGKTDTYIAYFAMPYDADTLTESAVQATDQAGNSSFIPFTTTVKPAQQKHDKITVGDGFLSSKIPEFQQHYPEMTGSMVERYLYTNSTVRVQNNTKISQLSSTSDPHRFWQGRFERMAGSTRSGYADHRTYYYNGQPIDKQVHLGMDIASTGHAKVNAANNGKVVFAGYLGIYGNMIMIDHGQGVFSLYSHLSQFNVKKGDMVTKADTIGLTGTTGMAGGDHLHFSMLINGIFATPIEWWDPHWIEVTIDRPLAAINQQ